MWKIFSLFLCLLQRSGYLSSNGDAEKTHTHTKPLYRLTHNFHKYLSFIRFCSLCISKMRICTFFFAIIFSLSLNFYLGNCFPYSGASATWESDGQGKVSALAGVGKLEGRAGPLSGSLVAPEAGAHGRSNNNKQ